jgi:nucleoporin GLE1
MARVRVQTPTNALRTKSASPKFDDSPSRQLMLDLERALCQVQIHGDELHKVHTHDRRLFQETLDLQDSRRAQQDFVALDTAKSRHESVRKEAEAELQRYYRELEEQERLKRVEEERRLREQRAREKAEAERKAREEAERKERIEREQAAARKAAEEKTRAEEADRRKREEDATREKAEQERRLKEVQESARARQQVADEKAARQRVQETAPQPAQSTVSQSQAPSVPNADAATLNSRYREIHRNLKKFRKDFWAECKKNSGLKSKVGDMRRAIKTSVGQLTEAKGANKIPVRGLLLAEMVKLILSSDRSYKDNP